jgi:hypothetical protein
LKNENQSQMSPLQKGIRTRIHTNYHESSLWGDDTIRENS